MDTNVNRTIKRKAANTCLVKVFDLGKDPDAGETEGKRLPDHVFLEGLASTARQGKPILVTNGHCSDLSLSPWGGDLTLIDQLLELY